VISIGNGGVPEEEDPVENCVSEWSAASNSGTGWRECLDPRSPPETLANNSASGQAVRRKLRLNWALKRIAGWLKRAHPEDESYQVSHETIYRSLFVQARGVLPRAH